MSAYYNEIDPFAAAWLRELIKARLIADGEVDERSIVDVTASDLEGFTQCHFFAGIGGWSYALRLAGWPDDRPVWTGSCPCQGYSTSGKHKGAADARNLWPCWFRLIQESRPERVFGEQVANATGHGWLDDVSTNLEAEDYTIGAVVLGAHSVGAPHIRQRLWFVAYRGGARLAPRDERRTTEAETTASAWGELERVHAAGNWPTWQAQSGVGVFDDGISNRLLQGGIKGFGNAIVPQVAAAFIQSYLEATA